MSPESRNTRNGDDRPRRHLPPVEDSAGGWTQQHSPYTIEGEIEGFARFATGVRRHPRRNMRLAGILVVVVLALPFVPILVIDAFRAIF